MFGLTIESIIRTIAEIIKYRITQVYIDIFDLIQNVCVHCVILCHNLTAYYQIRLFTWFISKVIRSWITLIYSLQVLVNWKCIGFPMINIPFEMPTSRFQVFFVYRERRFMSAEQRVVHKYKFACYLLLIEIHNFSHYCFCKHGICQDIYMANKLLKTVQFIIYA